MPPRLFELDGQWIGQEAGSPKLYRYWYDGGSGRVRRRSLGTSNLEDAKRKLAAVVVQGAAAQAERDPGQVMLVSVLAYALMRARIPLTPIILGLVLGPTLEREFRTALILSEGDPSIFVSSVPAVIFLVLAALVFAMPVWRMLRKPKIAEVEDNAQVRPE